MAGSRSTAPENVSSAGTVLLDAVAYSFEAMALRVDGEGSEVAVAVVRAKPGRPVVLAAGRERCGVEGPHRGAVGGRECEMKAGDVRNSLRDLFDRKLVARAFRAIAHSLTSLSRTKIAPDAHVAK